MMIVWLVDQLHEDAQPYHLEDDMSLLVLDGDESVQKRARFAKRVGNLKRRV